MASPTWWTWVWVDSRSWSWTGGPGVLGSQRVGHDWVKELDWTEGSDLVLKGSSEQIQRQVARRLPRIVSANHLLCWPSCSQPWQPFPSPLPLLIPPSCSLDTSFMRYSVFWSLLYVLLTLSSQSDLVLPILTPWRKGMTQIEMLDLGIWIHFSCFGWYNMFIIPNLNAFILDLHVLIPPLPFGLY